MLHVAGGIATPLMLESGWVRMTIGLPEWSSVEAQGPAPVTNAVRCTYKAIQEAAIVLSTS